MATRTRLILLVLALAYSTLFGPGKALGGAHARQHHGFFRLKVPKLRLHRVHAPRLAPPPTVGQRAVDYARRLVGVPYRYGGDSPQSGFDCSGFVRFVYRHFGLELPHSSYADFGLGRRVDRRSLRPGDLVFFDGVGHVGMYIGGGRFIHAPHTGTRVQVTSLDDPWYAGSYDGARRLFPLRRARPQPVLHAPRRPILPSLRLF
jgi:hypothetical protein